MDTERQLEWVRHQLDYLAGQRMLAPFTPIEAAEYARLGGLERELLTMRSTGWSRRAVA